MTNEFLDFVRIPSPSLRERRFAERVKRALADIGLKCREDNAGKQIGGECGNLFARVPGDRSQPARLFAAHLDTVESGAGIVPRLRNGVIRSSGKTNLGADDKVAVVAILEMLRVLKEQRLRHPPLEIVFTVSEETGLTGAKFLDCSRLRAEIGFILDAHGPVGGIINRAPAYDAIKAKITGRAAHAGAFPEEGISAIQIAAQAIAKMRLGRIDADTTANIGIISGGAARNVVPEVCCLEGEARSHREVALRRQVQQMLNCLHQAAAEFGGKLEVEIERQFEAYHAPLNSPPVRLAKRAARGLSLPFSARASGGGADTAIFAAAGIPSITVNVGYEDPHSVEERISLEQLRLLGEYTLALAMAGP